MTKSISANPITPDLVDAMSAHLQKTFREVAPIILENAGNIAFKDKHDGSPVTEIDKQVEDLILKSFKTQFPEIPIFGEESGYGADLPDFFWLIDPIDGTANFIKNIPTFTSMAVLISNDEILASVIYNPSTDELFVAKKGRGAYKNGARLDLTSKHLNHTILCKGRHIEALDKILFEKNTKAEIAPNGAGYGFGIVADGSVGARFQLHSRGQLHDYAPGALLVLEAGGVVIPIKEQAYTYRTNSFVASHPDLEKTIRAHINELRKLEL